MLLAEEEEKQKEIEKGKGKGKKGKGEGKRKRKQKRKGKRSERQEEREKERDIKRDTLNFKTVEEISTQPWAAKPYIFLTNPQETFILHTSDINLLCKFINST